MKKRILIFLLTLVMIFSSIPAASLSVSAADDTPGMYMNVDTIATDGNASEKGPLREGDTIYAGQQVYLNVSVTRHYKLANAKFYVCKPNSSSYIYAGSYVARNYFRYSATAYIFPTPGRYYVRCDVQLTDGRTASGTVEVNVVEAPKASANTVKNDNITINWSASRTSTTRDARHTVTINNHVITPGTIHKTYFANGTQSTAGNAYYCKYNNRLVYVAGGQCLNYIYYLQLCYFGVDSHTTVLKNSERDDGVSVFFGVRYNRKLSASEYKQLLQHTGAGTHLRVKWKSSTGHSIFVLAVTSNGFYYTDANTSAAQYGANNIKIGFTTFEDFAKGEYSYLSYVEYYHG